MSIDYANIKKPIYFDVDIASDFYKFMFDAAQFLDTLSITEYILHLIDCNPCEEITESQVFQWVVEFLDEDPDCYPYNDIDFDAIHEYERSHQKNIISLTGFYVCNKKEITNMSKIFPLSITGDNIRALNFPNATYFNEYNSLLEDSSRVYKTLESINIPSYSMTDGHSIRKVFGAVPQTTLDKLNSIKVESNDILRRYIAEVSKGDFAHLSPFGRSLNEAITKTTKGGSNV